MPRTTLLAALAAIAVAIGGYLTLSPAQQQEISLLPGAANAQTSEDDAPIDTSTVIDMVQGDADAPIEVIEYASFTCPHCANFHATVYPQLLEDYIDEGLVRFVYREIYFDRYGLWASIVARCAGPLRFFGVTDILYETQREWTDGEPSVIGENLRRIGRSAGLSDDELDVCLTDSRNAETLYTWFQENAERDEINGTPSFMINGEKYANMSYASFAEILDGLLAEAQ